MPPQETSPLLHTGPSQGTLKPKPSYRSVVTLLTTCNLCLAGASAFLSIPVTRLIEDNLCHRYINGSVDEKHCKTDRIQSQLAYLNGCLALVEALVGLVTAFPFGILADILGRKPIVFLSTLGSLLSLTWTLAVIGLPQFVPVHLILIGPLFTVVGGGSTVIIASLFSVLSDVVDEGDRASAFSIMTFASSFGASLGPAVSSLLMDISSPWLPALIGTVAVPAGVSVLLWVPETLPAVTQSRSADEQQTSLKWRLSQSLTRVQSSFAILRHPSVFPILATFLARMPEALATSQFFAQYVSKRFDWSLAGAGYLLALRGFIQMVVLLGVLPVSSRLLGRWQTSDSRDLVIARASALGAAMGALLMATASSQIVVTGLVLQTLGAGLAPLCRSLATGYLAARDTSKLNTLIGMVETAGALVAGPSLAWLFDWGLTLQDVWLGLPYFALTVAFLLCLLGLCFVRSPASRSRVST
ncbi:uncharacterized protein LDX57_004998 [Aspergillus melleus]|uniref:uncharacterized protein n=1 Tax=Aspergillus melleus TaxID=138277 RepID=UPI001E8E0737|nr:uncharacterized protein LDX57_004998 [Aspergillus melleus]KAH8427284.1 hypothetical protein LDX57_004998 [Aspergillus melleus]